MVWVVHDALEKCAPTAAICKLAVSFGSPFPNCTLIKTIGPTLFLDALAHLFRIVSLALALINAIL